MGIYRTSPHYGGKRGYGIVDQSVIQSDNAAMGNWQRRFNPAISPIAYHTSDEFTADPAGCGLSGLNALTSAFCWIR